MKIIHINSTRRSLLAGALGASALGLTSRLSVAGTGDTIVFDGSVFNPGVINLGSALPDLSVNTLTVEGPAAPLPMVILDGSAAGASSNGLRVTANSAVVRGLWLRNLWISK